MDTTDKHHRAIEQVNTMRREVFSICEKYRVELRHYRFFWRIATGKPVSSLKLWECFYERHDYELAFRAVMEFMGRSEYWWDCVL